METLSSALESWASFYANYGLVRTLVDFLHIGGLMLAGGFAVSADWATLKASKRIQGRADHLKTLGLAHTVVLFGLAAVVISGVLLFASDSDTFIHSIWFWIKMGLVVLLMVNGALLKHAERLAVHNAVRGWMQLQWISGLSIALWFLTTLAGAALPNAG